MKRPIAFSISAASDEGCGSQPLLRTSSVVLSAACALSIVGFGACGAELDEPWAELDEPSFVTSALTAEQCAFFSQLPDVLICKRNGPGKPYKSNPFNLASCINGFVGHPGDVYIGYNDPTCSGQGCYPLDAPIDPAHPIDCCEGLETDDDGYCAMPSYDCDFSVVDPWLSQHSDLHTRLLVPIFQAYASADCEVFRTLNVNEAARNLQDARVILVRAMFELDTRHVFCAAEADVQGLYYDTTDYSALHGQIQADIQAISAVQAWVAVTCESLVAQWGW